MSVQTDPVPLFASYLYQGLDLFAPQYTPGKDIDAEEDNCLTITGRALWFGGTPVAATAGMLLHLVQAAGCALASLYQGPALHTRAVKHLNTSLKDLMFGALSFYWTPNALLALGASALLGMTAFGVTCMALALLHVGFWFLKVDNMFLDVIFNPKDLLHELNRFDNRLKFLFYYNRLVKEGWVNPLPPGLEEEYHVLNEFGVRDRLKPLLTDKGKQLPQLLNPTISR